MTAWFFHWALESLPASSWSSSCPNTSWHTWHSNSTDYTSVVTAWRCPLKLLFSSSYIFPVSAFLQPYTSPKPPLPMIRCTLKSFMVSWGRKKEHKDFVKGQNGTVLVRELSLEAWCTQITRPSMAEKRKVTVRFKTQLWCSAHWINWHYHNQKNHQPASFMRSINRLLKFGLFTVRATYLSLSIGENHENPHLLFLFFSALEVTSEHFIQ